VDDHFTPEEKKFQLKLRTAIWALTAGVLYGIFNLAQRVWNTDWRRSSWKASAAVITIVVLLFGGTLYGSYWLDEQARQSRSLDNFFDKVSGVQAEMEYGGNKPFDWVPGEPISQKSVTSTSTPNSTSTTLDSPKDVVGVTPFRTSYVGGYGGGQKSTFRRAFEHVGKWLFPSAFAARLPVPGADRGTWGDILNEFIRVEHNEDGTHKDVTADSLTVTGASVFNGGAVFNEAAADVDFRIETTGLVNAFFVDADTDYIGFGTPTPQAPVEISTTEAVPLILRAPTEVLSGGSILRWVTGPNGTVPAHTSIIADIRAIITSANDTVPLESTLDFWVNTGDLLVNNMRLGKNGLMIGSNATPIQDLEVTDTGSDAIIQITSYEGDPRIWGRDADGALGAEGDVDLEEDLLQIAGSGWEGSAFADQVWIILEAAEAWSAGNHGAQINFWTTPKGSTTAAQVMRLDDAGRLGIGVNPTTLGSVQLHVADGAGTIPTMEPPWGVVSVFQRNLTDADPSAIMILAGENSQSKLYFADKDDGDIGYITFNHDTGTNSMTIGVNAADAIHINNTQQVGLGGLSSANLAALLHLGDTGNVEFGFTDFDNTDDDVNILQYVNCTDGTTNAEECDWFLQAQHSGSSGALATIMQVDGSAGGNVLFSTNVNIGGTPDTAGDLTIQVSAAELRMRLDNNLNTGNNGVNVSTDADGAGFNFLAYGSAAAGSSSYTGMDGVTVPNDELAFFQFAGGSTNPRYLFGTAGSYPLEFFTNQVVRMMVADNGMGVGITPATDFHIADVTNVSIGWTDLDTTDDDVSVQYAVDCTTTGTGAEDCDMNQQAQLDGGMISFLWFDADSDDAGGGTANDLTLGSSSVNVINILSDGTGTGELVLVADAIDGTEIDDGVCDNLVSVVLDPTHAGATDDYVSLNKIDTATGDASFSATETNEDSFTVPVGMVANNLRADIDTAPGAGNDDWRITLRDDAGSTSLTCDIDDTNVDCTDASNQPSIAAGSKLNLLIDSDIGGGGDPADPGEIIVSFCLTHD
jgi:hypothetical protein